MREPIFWLQTCGSIRPIYDDSHPRLLKHELGVMHKNCVDRMVKAGHWRIITNPLEAYALEIGAK